MKYFVWIGMVAVLLGGALFSSASAGDDSRAGSVAGHVSTADGDAAAGARIQLIVRDDRGNERVVQRTRAGRDGSFSFERVRPGRYLVRAALRGEGRAAERIAVRAGETTRVRLQLGR